MPIPTLVARLHAAVPEVAPEVWAAYVARFGAEEASRLAAAPRYLGLLGAVVRVHRAGGGIHELLDVLGAAISTHGGNVRAAALDWQEAICGELRVVDLAFGLRITLPPRAISGLRGTLHLGEGGGRPGLQFDNWSAWSVRALLLAETGNSHGEQKQQGGWGDRHGFHPSFITNGGNNQINHFALALRLYAAYRLPYWALVGPIPPQDAPGTADGNVTTAAYWFLHGSGHYRDGVETVPARDVAVLQAVVRDGLEAFR